MRKSDVIAYFGDEVKTAEALEITKQAVNGWPDPIPRGSAYEVEVITKGALKVNRAIYRKLKEAKRQRLAA